MARAVVNSRAAAVAAAAAREERPPVPTRRSSRRRAAAPTGPTPTIRGLPITAFRRPWTQHYIDIGHCRLAKCTKRIQEATDEELQSLTISFLAMAIKASTAYGPKARQEDALMDYANAVLARGMAPNDYDERLGSAVSMAAYFGYARLLQLLLDAGCPITNDGEPHALLAACKNTQHECMRLLLEQRPQEIRMQLHKETCATWNAMKPTTLKVAICAGDVEAVQLLRQQHPAKVLILLQSYKNRWIKILQQLYPRRNVLNWSQDLHWSFPGADRRMLNWLWHALKRQRERQNDNLLVLPSELWLRVFGFIGRGWWSLSTLGDQNGIEELGPSALT